jgi:hypothetical protein
MCNHKTREKDRGRFVHSRPYGAPSNHPKELDPHQEPELDYCANCGAAFIKGKGIKDNFCSIRCLGAHYD